MSIIRDPALAPSGRTKIDWVRTCMPVLSAIELEFQKDQPFKGLRVALSIHLEAKTANLARILQEGGAEVYATGCNPLSTQDDVAAALAEYGVQVYALHGATMEQYQEHLCMALACNPHLVLDDGGDLTQLLHGVCRKNGQYVQGITEETTTGITRLMARERAGELLYPAIAVNNADCKHLFDNRYGTGQSVWDAIMHTTNRQVSGKTVVVAGYGWCGRGVAMRARGLGASVVVTEVNAVKAIEAVMDGFRVMPMDQAAEIGDLFITVTGCRKVITDVHFAKMKSGAMLCNAGHFDVEIDVGTLKSMAEKSFLQRENIVGYKMPDGRVLSLLAEGRLVNLAAGNGHPAEIMDMSFALQALCLRSLAESAGSKKPAVYQVPVEIDRRVAELKLASMAVSIDSLTEDQKRYLNSF